MNKQRPLGVTIIGVIQISICLFLGIPSFIGGVSWFLLDLIAIATNGGGNLTGLGLIIGSMVALSGSVFLFGCFSAVLMLKLNPKGRKYTIIFMSIATALLVIGIKVNVIFMPTVHSPGPIQYVWLLSLVGAFNVGSIVFLSRPHIKQQFIEGGISVKQSWGIKLTVLFIAALIAWSLFNAIQGNISWNKKIAKEQKRESELENVSADQILRQFESSQYVPVRVICRIRQNLEKEDVEKKDIEAIQAKRRQFVLNNIIAPLGPNIREYEFYRWGDYDVLLVAEITRDAYARLSKNMHVWKIQPVKLVSPRIILQDNKQ